MRVLLVEDDPRIASDVARMLQASGYLVEIVSDGEEAWFRGDTEDYGAIILDLGLPGMDGLAVLKRWRANDRRTPVLVLTARGVRRASFSPASTCPPRRSANGWSIITARKVSPRPN